MHGVERAHVDPRHGPGRRRGGRHDGQAVGLRARPTGRSGPSGLQEQVDVGGDVVAQEATSSATTATSTATENSHAPIRRAAAWAAPLGECLPPFTPATRDGGPPAGSLPAADPGLPRIARTSAASSARTASWSIPAPASLSVRATDGTPVTDNCATAESSSARSCAAGGSGRPVRRRAAPARSASTTPTAPAANPATGRDFPSPQPCDSGTSTIPPFVSIMIWTPSSRSSSGSERFATSASSATPISKT